VRFASTSLSDPAVIALQLQLCLALQVIAAADSAIPSKGDTRTAEDLVRQIKGENDISNWVTQEWSTVLSNLSCEGLIFTLIQAKGSSLSVCFTFCGEKSIP